MRINNREIEIKFKIDKADSIRAILKNRKAQFFGRVFQRTVRFDTPNDDLEKRDQFLRTRTGFKNTITFKQKIENKKFKARKEIEFEISDPEKMNAILENLGFTKVLIMEKYREKWRLNNAEIVIDKLPMGTFIEIEGKEKAIKEMVEILRLNFKDRITSTYWDLWKEFSKKKGIKNENITFGSLKK